MKLIENKFSTVEFVSNDSIIVSKWHLATEKMTSIEFLESGQEFAKLIIKYNPERYLNLMNEFKFAIVPEIQQKIDEQVVSVFVKNGMKKIATVLPTEIFSQVSVEQMIEEDMSKKLQSKVFDNEQEARAWLLKK